MSGSSVTCSQMRSFPQPDSSLCRQMALRVDMSSGFGLDFASSPGKMLHLGKTGGVKGHQVRWNVRNNHWRAMLICMAAAITMAVPASAEPLTPLQPAPSVKEVEIGANAFSLADPVPEWVEQVSVPDAGATQQTSVLLADTQFHVAETPSTHVRRATVVRDAASLGNIGQIALSFVPAYQKLQLHTVRILRNGEAIDQTKALSVRFLQRETGLERGVYSGEVTASMLVSDLRVGDILETLYTIHGQNPVFGKKFLDAAGWDSPFPTQLRRVVLTSPADRTINWRFHADGDVPRATPTETVENGLRKLTFEGRRLRAVTPEPSLPSDYTVFRWLQFSEFTGWDEVVAWADPLFQVTDTGNEEFVKIVDRLRALGTEEERAAAALEFVQSEVRYFSISLGESSHRPAQPSTVLQRRYGDCKDKTLLLMSLLRALGIESRPALLKLGGSKWLAKALPSPDAFDHVIVHATVGGQNFYLDPTRLGQHGRLRRMGQVHEEVMALVVASPSNAPATITSANAAELTRNELSEVATLTKFDGPAQLRHRQVLYGVGAEYTRVARTMMPPAQLFKPITSIMELRYPGAKLAGEPQFEDDIVNNVVTVTCVFDIPNLAVEKDGNWYVRFLPMNMRGALPLYAELARKAPIVMPAFPYNAKYSLEVQFPDSVSALRDPFAKTIDDKHFSYGFEATFRGNVAKTAIELTSKADRIELADIGEFIGKRRSLNDAMGVITISQSDIKSGVSAGAAFAERLRARLQEGLDKTTETIKSGKLSGGDLADAYCSRSLNNVDLGMLDEALQDANEATKIAPNAGDSYVCRGYAYLSRGEFAKSIADYSKAITLGSRMSDIHKARGVAKFYAGRLEEAAEDFGKASDANDTESILYSRLWLSWTLQRLNKPLPDAVASRAASEAHGEWPRPALAVLAGALRPEEMLKMLDDKKGDDRDMALAEGYFYLGQFYAARGETEKARDYFEKTRRQQVLPYMEHMAAGFELKLSQSAR
jgi:lipoprotein NlpI/transglutaminase-like putative cysteine protease